MAAGAKSGGDGDQGTAVTLEADVPRFVILEHDHPVLHWDLMLEAGSVLNTWRLAVAPEPNLVIDALALGDHRLAYLEYEGPVSGNRVLVKCWYSGELSEMPDSTPGTLLLLLHGARVDGFIDLTMMENERWQFRWTKP